MNRLVRYISVVLMLLTGISASSFSRGNRVVTYDHLDATADSAKARVTTTYYDRLGRERMRISDGAGGAGQDVAYRTDYDARGNRGVTWLAVAGNHDQLLDDNTFKALSRQLYGDNEIAFSTLLYDETGMNRQIGEDGPGLLWSGHNDRIAYAKNEQTGEYCCIKLIADNDGTVTACGLYAPNTLSVTEKTNADGLRVLAFKNRAGKIVMQRRIGTDGTTADIRFIYDACGDLRCTISPEGSNLLPTSGAVDADILDKYGQRYDYDLWHHCISAKAPGCGAVQYVYNRLDAVCLESTAEQRTRGEWTVIKYDAQHRPAVRGLAVIPGATRASLQAQYGDSLMQETFVPDLNEVEASLMYTNRCGPLGFEPYIAWYYDNYDFIVGPNASMKPQFESAGTDGYTQKSLCTGTAQKTEGTGAVWFTATKLNDKEKPVLECLWDLYLQTSRHIVSNVYDFTDNKILSTDRLETVSEATVTDSHTTVTRTVYDSQGRPIKQLLSVDGGPDIALSEVTYDAVGRIASDKGAVSTTFAYDIRSNVVGIISERFSQQAWFGRTAVQGAPVSYTGINALCSQWSDGQDASGVFTKTEIFTYDALGRYKSSVNTGGDISETVTADLDANITEIKRVYNGDVVQDASIMYDGGKAVSVYDDSSPYWAEQVGRFAAGDYDLTYDADGRLTKDGTRNVRSITYQPFGNLPRRVTMANGDYMHSTYLPDGTLQSRQFCTKTVRTVIKVTADGDTIVKTYPRNKITTRYYSGQYEKSPEGLIYHTEAGFYDFTRHQHYWYLRDRMGSTAAVIDSAANLLQTTAYYPSGTPHRIAAAIATTVDESTDRLHIGNRWLSHSGLNWYDNTARMHDPLLMRFATPDPLWQKYPGFSLWSHCAANPVNLIDADGAEWKAIKDQYNNTTGYEWVEASEAYDKDGNLLPGMFKTAILFTAEGKDGKKFDPKSKYNIGTSTAIVYGINGKDDISTFEACTIPSDTDKYPTIPNGDYVAKKGMHNGKYIALRLGDLGTTDFDKNQIELGYQNPSKKYKCTKATGINIHKAGVKNLTGTYYNKAKKKESGISEGCLLINRNQWNDFISKFPAGSIISVTVQR